VRIAPGNGVPFTPAGPKTPPPEVTGPAGSGGDGLGAGSIVVIVAAIVLVVDGVIVLVVRRRRRRGAATRRPPGA